MTPGGFKKLIAWRLSRELKLEVMAFTSVLPASKDFKFCDQIRDSSRGAPRTIAEGYGRGRPIEFARYLEFALASLQETINHLIDAHESGYITASLFTRLNNLAGAAFRATEHLRFKQLEFAGLRNVRQQPQGFDVVVPDKPD